MKKSGKQPGEDPGRIAYLIDGFLRNRLTDIESEELDAWIESTPENMRLFEELTDEENLQAAQTWFAAHNKKRQKKNQRYQAIRQRIGRGVDLRIGYLAAACLFALCIGIYFLATRSTTEVGRPMAHNTSNSIGNTEKPMLITADGRRIVLDSTSVKGEGVFRLQDGVLTLGQEAADHTGFHTITVPEGKQLQVVLADSSVVFLNAATTLSYPADFGKAERKLTLLGEAFFDVRHNSSMPFSVTSKEQTVTVLGTRFNVAGYAGEVPVTTLVNGSVKVAAGQKQTVLTPGQQSRVSEKGITVQTVDPANAIAWKEGWFRFRSAPIETVASQLQHWYGVEIEYRGKPLEHFNATVKRTEDLQRVLQVLEGSGYVQFKLEGKKLIIQP